MTVNSNVPLSAMAPMLLKRRDAAKMLQISERFLWGLTANGDIKSIRIGQRAVRYALEDLHAFIESRSSRAER